ncbi:hypothetical protein C5167_013001 [Papaver somniferum]|uniref:Uncharacterized protein n=1 Tax=Papaver somniferum TaxID=3469 RepID=A0A4Y7J3C6_PAPSO|nr:hypothetical protein C5167_013001 [Papaver somniferum]
MLEKQIPKRQAGSGSCIFSLPIKSLDGKLLYKTAYKARKESKMKKTRKEAKKQQKGDSLGERRSYQIRLPRRQGAVEQEMNVSKEVKKNVYLQESNKPYRSNHPSNMLLCIASAVINNMSSPDDVIRVYLYEDASVGYRKLCCTAIKSQFLKESKHGGVATVEAVHLIENHVKLCDRRLHPDTIEV